jgi:signal transduction histidine kinase
MTTMMGTMTETTRVTTERRSGPALMRRVSGDLRVRILASYVVLLALASIASVLVVRQVQLARLDEQVDEDLTQEVQELRRLAEGNDPETGRPFGADVQRIFSVYLDRNVPGEDEQLLTIPREGAPRFRATERANVELDPAMIARWRRLAETERGELETVAGEARYVALPLIFEGRTEGTFVVASFTEAARDEILDAVRVEAIVSLVVLALGTLLAFLISGRVLRPVRSLRDAARSVSGTELRRRIEVEGEGDLADLGRSFNAMLERLEQAFSFQRDFIRDISHELRTPIAVVRGHIELLAEGRLGDEGERAAAMALITRELDRMTRFVDDLLLLARTEQPDFLQLETVSLEELCEGLVRSGRALAEREWALEGAPRNLVVADRQRLAQAMMNLMTNAIEHTSDGDRIAVGASVDGRLAHLHVEDSGEGIAPADQERVFDRFARGRQSRSRYEGSGLGLAIVRAIAEAHGGEVGLSSRPGEGARFEIAIPVEGPQEPGPGEEPR